MLLGDNEGRDLESPLLPSLTKLVLINNTALCPLRTLRLCDALMKRVEEGVPIETLDLRTCLSGSRSIELLSEIVVDVLGPEEIYDEDWEDMGRSDVVREMWEIEDERVGSKNEADYYYYCR